MTKTITNVQFFDFDGKGPEPFPHVFAEPSVLAMQGEVIRRSVRLRMDQVGLLDLEPEQARELARQLIDAADKANHD